VILEEDVTAREAARTADLSDDQRPHLDRLVRDAELAHFGDRPVDIEGYGAARGACVSLLVSEGVRP
jgi:hypothetical protein